MELPTVTTLDLREFHAKHFPTLPIPEIYLTEAVPRQPPTEAHFQEEEEEDDGLGYYEDGTKRTLTDEQIALFRHTEIQQILRERRRKLERAQDSERNTDDSRSGSMEATASVGSEQRGPAPGQSMAGTASAAQNQQRWLHSSEKTKDRQRRKNQRRKQAIKRRKKDQKQRAQEGTRTPDIGADEDSSDEWDPRRQATGPDVQTDTVVDLDY